jgi:flagellar hook protein FlgE
MFQSFYTGLSGMMAFSKSLDTVSNNIANMNTPGFRGADSFYQSLNGQEQTSGGGVQISGLGFRFSNGEIRQTGNNMDLAINGAGFFSVLRDGKLFLTRSGQFAFDDKGMLIERTSNSTVAVLDNAGQPGVFDISALRQTPATASTKVSFNGVLSKSSAATDHPVSGVQVYTKLGEPVKLSVKFEKDSVVADSWKVTVQNSDNSVVLHQGELKFMPDGNPLVGFRDLTLQLPDSYGGKSELKLDFSNVTSLALGATHTLKMDKTDGVAAGTLQDITFDNKGLLKLSYSNGITKDGPALALVDVADKESLQHVEGSLFQLTNPSAGKLGRAAEQGFGALSVKSLELSNVDLSKEFADMIIIQRGYQASSKIMNVANQMLDQLFENTRGR